MFPQGELPPTMPSFPEGACGDASLLLGAYLADNGYGSFKFVHGLRNTGFDGTYHHCWLARGALVVDITADQFSDAPEKVIVAVPSEWHRCFELDGDEEPGDFREWPTSSHINDLACLYRRLQIAINSSCD